LPRAYSYTTSKGVTFFLHAKDVPLPNGREQRIYYFRRDALPAEAVATPPQSYAVVEDQHTGLPYLKRTSATGTTPRPSRARRARRPALPGSVKALLRQLGSARRERLQDAIGTAASLLEKHARHKSYEWLTGDPARLRRFFADWEEERPGYTAAYVHEEPTRIRERYAGDLPEGLLDVRLEDAEVRALLAALASLLDGHRGMDVAGSAAWATSKYSPPDLPAVPAVTALLARCTPERDGQVLDADDAWGAHQAAYALDLLLERIDRDGPVTEDQREKGLAACQALARAATVAGTYRPPNVPSYVPDPREAAAQVLFWTAFRFADQEAWQRLSAEWERMQQSGEASGREVLVWAVTGAEPQADRTVVVDGVFVTGTQPAVGKEVTVFARGGPAARAVLRDFRFDVREWPPRVALVLDGSGGAAAAPGAWVTSTLSEQHRGDFSEANLERLEEMLEPREHSPEEFLAILDNPMGAAEHG
jgi:hypothetical protein